MDAEITERRETRLRSQEELYALIEGWRARLAEAFAAISGAMALAVLAEMADLLAERHVQRDRARCAAASTAVRFGIVTATRTMSAAFDAADAADAADAFPKAPEEAAAPLDAGRADRLAIADRSISGTARTVLPDPVPETTMVTLFASNESTSARSLRLSAYSGKPRHVRAHAARSAE